MQLTVLKTEIRLAQVIVAVMALAGLLALTIAATVFLPPGIDWHHAYRPAALALVSGESPYSVDVYFAAPWTLIPLAPLAVLPEPIGRAGIFTLGLVAYAYSALRLGAKVPALIAFLLSPLVLHNLLNSNVEWMPILGFTLPPQIGLFFVLVKPQVGVGVALYWVVEAWRRGRVREVVKLCWPVAGVTLLSFGLYGFWPGRFGQALAHAAPFNASLWPVTLPLGLTLLVSAVRKRQIRWAMPVGPCLSPYALFHSWAAVLASILVLDMETIVAVIGLWALVVIRALMGGL